MRTALLFPGMSLLKPGVSQDTFAAYPYAKNYLAEYSELFGLPLADIISGTAKDEYPLDRFDITQIVTWTLSQINVRILCKETGRTLPEIASILAGHSAGEYAAASAAGILPDRQVQGLFAQTHAALRIPAEQRPGAMLSVAGISLRQAYRLASSITEHENDLVCQVAAHNALRLVLFSGDVSAIERLQSELSGMIVTRIDTGIWPHTKLMSVAVQPFEAGIDMIEAKPFGVPVLLNATHQPARDLQDFRAGMIAQLTQPVLWRRDLKAIQRLGVSCLINVGPGGFLALFAKMSGLRFEHIHSMHDLKGLQKCIKFINSQPKAEPIAKLSLRDRATTSLRNIGELWRIGCAIAARHPTARRTKRHLTAATTLDQQAVRQVVGLGRMP